MLKLPLETQHVMSIIRNYQATSDFWDKNTTKVKVSFEKEIFKGGRDVFQESEGVFARTEVATYNR